MSFDFQCNFNFSKGIMETQLNGQGARAREKEFENYLSKKINPVKEVVRSILKQSKNYLMNAKNWGYSIKRSISSLLLISKL